MHQECMFGAICIPGMDGLSASCQCPKNCSNYGIGKDDAKNGPLCGLDGKYYKNQCEMKIQSCQIQKNIEIKFYGKCGKYCIPFL